MRVKLQLVICHDDGHEETVTDVITLNKNNQRIEHLGLSLAESKQPPQHPAAAPPPAASHHLSRHVLDLSGLRDTTQAQGPRQPVVSHLVWHVYV